MSNKNNSTNKKLVTETILMATILSGLGWSIYNNICQKQTHVSALLNSESNNCFTFRSLLNLSMFGERSFCDGFKLIGNFGRVCSELFAQQDSDLLIDFVVSIPSISYEVKLKINNIHLVLSVIKLLSR